MLHRLQIIKRPMMARLFVCVLWIALLGCERSSSSDTEGPGVETPVGLSAGSHTLRFDDGQLIYVYVSPAASREPESARILASIHGFSGRLNEQSGQQIVQFYRDRWIEIANQYGWVVVAPQFDELRFDNNYQRLNPFGTRADFRLNDISDYLGELLPGLPTEKILLFGFSGGGQFAHRYVAAQPERIERAVAASPGWYLWPDETLPYPVGTDTRAVPEPLTPSFQALCDLPFLLMIGENDTVQGGTNRENSGIDLIALQGSGRLAKATNWVAEVQKLAAQQGWPCRLEFDIIPRTGHTSTGAIFTGAADFLRAQE